MGLKLSYDAIDDVPEVHRELYTDQGGKFVLTGVEGVKSQADIDRMNVALQKERDAHKATKSKYSHFENLDATEVLSKLDRFEELEAAAAGKLDENAINGIVETRIKSKTAPLEREKAQLAAKLAENEAVIQQYQARERQRSIHDAVRSVALKSKVTDTALEDVLMLAERVFDVDEDGNVTAKDNVGVTPGVSPEVWLQEMQSKRPHWWPASGGGGASGSQGGGGYAGANPFAAATWNATEQGRIFRENPKRAEQLAAAAGTKVGGMKPSK